MTDRGLPTGTLTFLFTDLEGSTRLLHELGEDYDDVLEQLRALIRAAVADHGGIEFGTGGDALFVVFESAAAATGAAADAQRALARHEFPDSARVRVRMGLHTGDARIVDGDYVGLPLHVVSRLCAAGHGGQVLVSQTTALLAPQAEFRDLGEHRLRDVPEPLQILQLTAEGIDAAFPSLRTLTTLPNNLPAPSDRIVGRELETIEVMEALREHRLVTLTGPGGAGKTRLALDVAAALLPEAADGTWLVPLAAASVPDEVTMLTAHALGVNERGDEPLEVTLANAVDAKRVLFVFDNCEHLVDRVARFVDLLLKQCANVRVLATSREVLGIAGETSIAVKPLDVGSADHPGAAVSLFRERARAIVPGFDDATEDVGLIAEVCRHLDGLPLAIELAAARLRSMSLPQIADRLDDRFRLLSTGARTADARQQTLENVVAWSYDLLDERERAVFRRVSLFPDSFTLDAAESVSGWGVVESIDVLDIIARLVDKSLVLTARVGNEYRYSLLETLRQYGRARLAEDDIAPATQVLHAWARRWTERLEADMRTSRQDQTVSAASRERGNLRMVFEQARQAGDNELALRIVTYAPIMSSEHRREAVDELLPTLPDVPPMLHGHALVAYSQFALDVARFDDGLRAARRAGEIFGEMGDQGQAAWARYFEVFHAWSLLEEAEVRAIAAEVLDQFRRLDEPLGLAYMLWVLSQLDDDLDVADAYADEAEQIFRALGSPFGLAHDLEGRALLALERDDMPRAAGYLTEALRLLGDSGVVGCIAHVLEATASLLIRRDLVADAACLLGAAEVMREASGHGHRPWELRGRALAEDQLSGAELDEAREIGRRLDAEQAVERARVLLGQAGAYA